MENTTEENDDNFTMDSETNFMSMRKPVPSMILLDVFSFVIVLIEVASLYVLRKCVLITEQIKIISRNLLLSDLCFHVTNVLLPATVTDFNRSDIVLSLATLKLDILYVLAVLYCLFMVQATLDRWVSVKYTVKYNLILPPYRVRRLAWITWFIVFCGLLLPVAGSTIFHCFGSETCHIDLESRRTFRLIISLLLFFCDVLVIIFYFFILVVANLQFERIRHQYPTSHMRTSVPAKRIMTIVGAFVIFYSPFVVFTVIIDIFGVELPVTVFAMFYILGIRVSTSFHSCLSLYYYLYSMPECRMVFLRTFLAWNRRCKEKQEKMKVEIFNIPVMCK